MVSLTLLGCEVVYFGPVIVPGEQVDLRKLGGQGGVLGAGETRKVKSRRTLDDGLALAKQREVTVVALVGSELASSRHNH